MQAWEAFLEKQENFLGKQTVDKWLRPIKVVHFDSGNLYLEASATFQITWFEEHIRPLLKRQLVNNNFRPIKVYLSLAGKINPNAKPSKYDKPTTTFVLDPIYQDATFDTWVAGKANDMHFRLLSEMQTAALPIFNPIFIWGSSGTGKTHLLMALTQAFKKRGLHPLYSRTETFTEHVVSAIRSSDMQRFRNMYRTPDVLLIDDVHLLARKNATQEEFFHTFNALHTTSRQIILSSQYPPSLLTEIEPRLISRFEWGIALHIEKLSAEELSEVLSLRCAHLHFPLSQNVRAFLVDTFLKPHTLHRALEALILRVHLLNDATYHRQSALLTIDTVSHLLHDLITQAQSCALTPEKIIHAVSSYYDIRGEDVLGKSQVQECVLPRHLAMYLCRTQLKLSFKAIGRLFSRDHSTVMTSIKSIQGQLDKQNKNLTTAFFEILHSVTIE